MCCSDFFCDTGWGPWPRACGQELENFLHEDLLSKTLDRAIVLKMSQFWRKQWVLHPPKSLQHVDRTVETIPTTQTITPLPSSKWTISLLASSASWIRLLIQKANFEGGHGLDRPTKRQRRVHSWEVRYYFLVTDYDTLQKGQDDKGPKALLYRRLRDCQERNGLSEGGIWWIP